MQITNLGCRTDLMLLQLGGSELTDRGEYVVVRTPANPTFWWGNFLLFRTAFGPGSVEVRLEMFRSEFPDAQHVALGVDTTDGVIGAADELKAAGFESEGSTVMSATEVQAPTRPNTDATIRRLTSDDDWTQLFELGLLTTDSTFPGHAEFAARRNDENRRLTLDGHGAWFGAFDGDRLRSALGLVSDGSGVARFQHVQTHPDARNQGLASTLVHHASTYGFAELGARTLVMVADPEYLAIRIYRALGFSDNETQLQFTKHP